MSGGVARRVIECFTGGGQGAAEVGAGVAVGDRKHVDQVERFTMQGDPTGGAANHALEIGAGQAEISARRCFPFDHL